MPPFQQNDRLVPLKAILLVFTFLFFYQNGNAQSGSCPEKFRAYNSVGKEVSTFCVGETIRFKSCSANAQPDKEYYDTDKTNGLAFPDTVKSVTYSVPGTYTVTQLINTGLPGNNQFERTFTVLPTPIPEVQTVDCAFNQVKFKITDNNYDVYRLAFGDSTERRVLPGKDTVYQYKAPGSYTITLKAAYRQATCVVVNSVSVQTLPAIGLPVLNRVEVTNSANQTEGLVLTASDLQTEYEYLVEKAPAGSTNFQEIHRFKPVPGENLITLPNPETRNIYQYRLQVTDACGTLTKTFSNLIYTQNLQIQAQEKAFRLTWSSYPNIAQVTNYQIYRDKKLLQTVSATTTSFQDVSVACGRQYCYQVVAVLSSNRSSVSAETCQRVIATIPPKPGFVIASFNLQNQVELVITPGQNETLQEVSWQKQLNNNSFSPLSSSKQHTFVDATVYQPTNKPCYQATYTDSCGLVSGVSNISCPAIITSNYNEKQNTVTLSWSPYVGFPAAPTYTLEVLDEADGRLLNSYQVGSKTQFTDKNLNNSAQILLYRIKASDNAGHVSYSNQVSIVQPFTATIPSAFSPNNDGLNDIFEVKGKFIDNVILKIYNRWGQVIFESKNPNQGWDGKIKGQDAPVGTYVFSLTAEDRNGNTIQRTGSVTLIK